MSMMMSNLLSGTSEFRPLQLRSISPGMSSGGLLSHKSRSIAFGNSAGGRLPGQLVKLQLSQVPRPLAITNDHVRASCYRPPYRAPWYDMEHPMNWGMLMVSHTSLYLIERFGKYAKTLTTPGIHFLIPFVDKVAYVHSRGREGIAIPEQRVFTKDGCIIESINGCLIVQIVDPILASYGEGNLITYMTQLARACIRSEVGKMTEHMIAEDSDALRDNILKSISEDEGVKRWGLQCHHFHLFGVLPLIMEFRKRKIIQERKMRAHLEHEVDAEGIIGGAHVLAEDITMVSKNLKAEGGVEVSSLRIAEDEAFDKIAQRVAFKVFAMIENSGLLSDAANRSVMKGETNQASLPQSKYDTDAVNPSAKKGETDHASLSQSKHDAANPSSAMEGETDQATLPQSNHEAWNPSAM